MQSYDPGMFDILIEPICLYGAKKRPIYHLAARERFLLILRLTKKGYDLIDLDLSSRRVNFDLS
jgi:hypothetical protein